MPPTEPTPSALQLRRLLQVYSTALRADPSNLVQRTKLAEVLRLLGRHEEAVSLYSGVAWAHGVSGNLGQAIMICKLILELNPHHSATQEMLAKLYASKQVRDQKQSVPVVNVNGRWVADPRQATGSRSRAPAESAPPADEAKRMLGSEPRLEIPDVLPVARGSFDASREEIIVVSDRGSSGANLREKDPALITSCEVPSALQRRRGPAIDGRFEALEDGLRKLAVREAAAASQADASRLPRSEPGVDDLPPTQIEPLVDGGALPATSSAPPLAIAVAGTALAPSDEPAPAVSLRHLILTPEPALGDGEPGLDDEEPASSTPLPDEQFAPVAKPLLSTLLGFPAPAATGAQPGGPAPRAPGTPPKRTERMDAALVNSLLRMDAEQVSPQRPPTQSYVSIQREVNLAGHEQEQRELPPEEEAEAERNLLDTLREAPAVVEAEQSVERYVVPFPLLSDLDTAAFLAVIRRLERRVVAVGSWVCREGDAGDSLYLVSSGVLQVMKETDRGQPIQLARLGGGSFFGEFGLLTDGRRHASVRCLEEAELLELHRDVLVQLCEEHPSIAWTLRTFYQQRVMSMVIATSAIFQAVRAEDRKSVLSRFGFRRFMSNEIIIEEDRQGTGFYVILVGSAGVSRRADDGSEVQLGVLSEGDYFGEMSLLSGFGAEATVRATTVTEVLMLSPQDFYGLTADHPEIWAVVQDKAERRRQDTARRMASRQPPAGGDLCLI